MVLGGGGFLGTHLVNDLLRQGASVRMIDRHPVLCPGPAAPGLEVCWGDLTTGSGIEASLRGVDLVYHLISTTVPSTSNADPIADVESNLVGSLRLLQMMKTMEVGRIVYISSGGTVYGNPSILPVPESHPLNPLCSYGVVKVAVENYLQMFSALYGLTATVLRVSNPYGPHQRHLGVQGVIATFFKKVIDGQAIEIWGDGSVVRDYIYVGDVVVGMLRAGSSERSGTYNIGSGVGHCLNEVLHIVCKLTGRKADVTYLPHRKFDVGRIFLDIGKASKELDWRPSLTLEQGCLHYWNIIKDNEGCDSPVSGCGSSELVGSSIGAGTVRLGGIFEGVGKRPQSGT